MVAIERLMKPQKEQNKQKQTHNQSEKERSNKLAVKPLDMNFKIDDNLEEMPEIKEK